eukprot:jgi/Chrzof1/11533/UNPLg00468.t1
MVQLEFHCYNTATVTATATVVIYQSSNTIYSEYLGFNPYSVSVLLWDYSLRIFPSRAQESTNRHYSCMFKVCGRQLVSSKFCSHKS